MNEKKLILAAFIGCAYSASAAFGAPTPVDVLNVGLADNPSNGNLVFTTEVNEDTDGDGFLDVAEDLDGDGNLDVPEDLDGDGVLDLFNEDIDGDGTLDVAEDADGDGTLDTLEDLDGDLFFDIINEDANGNGILDPGEDLDGDNHLDFGIEDADGDGNFDINEDGDGDGFLDVAEDLDGDGNLDVPEDLDGDGVLDLLNEDIDGDGTLDVAEDVDGDGVLDLSDELNIEAQAPDGSPSALNIEAMDLLLNGESVALQSDVDQNELDSDNADIALQADVDQNELDSDNADIALQSDVDQNELDSDNADIALQADIDQNEADTDALIHQEVDGIHIGTSSFVFDEFDAAGHRLFTSDGSDLVLGGGANNTNVDVDGVLSLAGGVGYSAVGNVAQELQNQNDWNAAQDVTIANNQSNIANNSSGIKKNKDDIETNTRGIAMVAALQHTTVLPGMTNALDVGAAYFEGETGMSLNYARRINENWQINFGAASTTDFDESVVKAGVGVQW